MSRSTRLVALAQAVGADIKSLQGQVASSFGVGDIKTTARTAAPTGWLRCDGQSLPTGVPATTALRAALIANGNKYGVVGADPKVPNFNDRLPIGASPTSTRVVGAAGGAETVTLAMTHMPSHSHRADGVGGGGGYTNGSDRPLSHSHRIDWQSVASGGGYAGFVTGAANPAGTFSGDTPDHLHSINANGGGVAHDNMPPTIAVTYLIKL